MKNTLILLFIAVLLAAYFILQDDGSMVAPQPDTASPDITDEHVPVEESHGTVLVEDDKVYFGASLLPWKKSYVLRFVKADVR